MSQRLHTSGGKLMKTFFKSLVAVGAVIVALLVAPAAFAQCSNSLPASHSFTFLTGLPESDLSGRVFVLGSALTTNSGSTQWLCASAADISAGGGCQPEAGTATDEN